ncbi:MAG: sigma 54-interacting transcriptional regulator [Acidobacteria bacterium]|nr:sigma 54-interacting transcriptional regulator [Acidobacteriota bacterium]
MSLPKILIIDDVLGQPDNVLGRERFCKALGLKGPDSGDIDKAPSKLFLAEVQFESGQLLSSGYVENSTKKALAAIERGWPFPDGSRWALVCVDLEFVVGSSDKPSTEFFGAELLRAIEDRWRTHSADSLGSCEVPVVMLSSHDPTFVERRVKTETNVAFLEKWKGDGDSSTSMKFRIELGKVLFKIGLVADGELRHIDSEGVVTMIDRLPRPEIFGRSLSLLSALREARKSLLRERDVRVLLVAERGSGKELFVQYLHDHAMAARSYVDRTKMQGNGKRELVPLNLQEVSESLIESRLKGAVRGAYTGADRDFDGCLEVAKGGTLHLDEIGNLGFASLQMLLRIVESETYKRVGDTKDRVINCQIVMTTNKDVAGMVGKGTFPDDLFDRLAKLTVPPLRARADDAILIFERFVLSQTKMLACREKAISSRARRRVNEYEWPGNVRQLRAVSEQVVADREYTGLIDVRDIDAAILRTGAELQKRWTGRYEELLTAIREYSFSSEEVKSAWPRLQNAIGVLASNMLTRAVADSSRPRNFKRVDCVNRIANPSDECDWESKTCERWLQKMQDEFGLSGAAFDELMRKELKSLAKPADKEIDRSDISDS